MLNWRAVILDDDMLADDVIPERDMGSLSRLESCPNNELRRDKEVHRKSCKDPEAIDEFGYFQDLEPISSNLT